MTRSCFFLACVAAMTAGAAMADEPTPQPASQPDATTQPTSQPASQPSGFSGYKQYRDHLYCNGCIHYSIVFVIDRSTSMAAGEAGDSPLKIAKQLMDTHIRTLPAEFHIIFLTDGKPMEMESNGFVPPTKENKIKALEFLDSVKAADGKTVPSPPSSGPWKS